MQRVMIESPFRAENFEMLVRNLDYAHACVRDSLRRREAPFAMHLFYPNYLDEYNAAERAQGITCGLMWLRAADKVALYIDHGKTPGMLAAEELALQCKIPVVYRRLVE